MVTLYQAAAMDSDQSSSNRHKHQVINHFLEGDHVLLHINPKAEGVVLPPHLASQTSVTLKISRFFRGFMEVTEEKISADLLFGGRYFSCGVPMAAVWGCTNAKGENIIWPGSTTPEILQQIGSSVAKAEARTSAPGRCRPGRPRAGGGHLKRIK